MKLFGGLPDVARVASDTGLASDDAERLLLELAWITKTVSRLGKGYFFGDHMFSRPGSTADLELSSYEALSGDTEIPDSTSLVTSDELASALADRTGFATDATVALVASVAEQVAEVGGAPIKVASRLLELERVVEDQLMDAPSTLDIWGWGLSKPRRQVHLDSSSRADIVGQLADGTWVVVELKRGAALGETADQVLRYIPLVRDKLAGADPVVGLVIADGDDAEFHERVFGSGESISYLPTRCLDLSACRPQTYLTPLPGSEPVDDTSAPGEGASVTVAADGITVVAAQPSALSFDLLEPVELWSAGRRLLDEASVPLPVVPLGEPSK